MKLKLSFIILLFIGCFAFISSARAIDFTSPTFKDESFKAQYHNQSIADPITVEAGQTKEVVVRFKNTGQKSWSNTAWDYVSVYTINPKYRASVFFNSSWLGNDQPAKVSATVKPGAIGEFKIKLTAPAKAGDYKEDFYLAAENTTWIKGGYFYLKIKVIPATKKIVSVSKIAAVGATTTLVSTTALNNVTSLLSTIVVTSTAFSTTTTLIPRQLISEPLIRVGLYEVSGSVKFVSKFNYYIYSDTAYRGTLPADEEATLSYKDGVYYFKSASFDLSATDSWRLESFDTHNYFTLLDYNRTVSYRGKQSFNTYRGIMEFRYSPKSSAPYVINELPLDLYIAGIAETDNESAPEYIKAVLTAARSYAYFNITNNTAKNNLFDVYASTIDQLYLGYNSEVLMPKVAKLAKDTYGEMVTYQKQPVTAPYFGHSDGNTRTWKEVWGGTNKPWLQRVVCKYDQGLSMYGHGVGMSTRDASMRAVKDKWDYKQILKHYYTGVEVENIY